MVSIGDQAFKSCKSLTDISLPTGLKEIGAMSFCYCSAIENIELPSDIKSIGMYAFFGCTSLESIKIPAGIESLNLCVFRKCKSLKSVIFEDDSKLTDIFEAAFYDCRSLNGITLPSGVTNIGKCAFSDCYSLESIDIPPKVIEIDNATFRKCKSLNQISIPEGVTRIGVGAFKKTKYYNDPSNWEDGALYVGTALVELKASDLSVDLIIKDTTRIIADSVMPSNSPVKNLTVPKSVTHIGEHSFDYNSLTTVTFESGSSLACIGEHAFDGTSLATVEIPSSVTEMNPAVFYGCQNLTTVTFEKGCQLSSVGSSMFCGCSSLREVEIPRSVTSIDGSAFSDCTSLKDVYFEGSQADIEKTHFNTTHFLNDADWHYDSKMPVKFVGIGIRTNPTKTVYAKGEDLDLTGLTLNAIYSDGSTQPITDISEVKVVEYDSKHPYKQRAKIEYAGCSAEIDIKVDYTFLQWAGYLISSVRDKD